jgi:6-phospho-beta-glucosidase
MKTAVIGCGLRTPLLVHGLARAGLGVSELALYDAEPERARLMAALGAAVAEGSSLGVRAEADLAAAIRDCAFVISSIRVGGMEARARDERRAVECGFVGQETTGPAGCAMALRTVPVALEHARLIEKLAPGAWLVNFTNPAGLITQAITTHTEVRVAGICDTPSELFFRIAVSLGEPPEAVEYDYLGLNHLGWVRGVRVRGEDVTERLLADDELLRRLYPAPLFDPELLRELRLIPTEYVYFYYNQRTALRNELAAGATRGEELAALNREVMAELEACVRANNVPGAIRVYRAYLNRRNSSYMHLEGSGKSAFEEAEVDWDPFEGATGYHRIAVDAIAALSSERPGHMVLNVPNGGAVADLRAEDVAELPCVVDRSGARPVSVGELPEAVRGLVISVKEYERLTIEAAVRKDRTMAALALLENPMVGDWEGAREFLAGVEW